MVKIKVYYLGMSDYQLFGQLSDKEYQQLKADIATRGIMVPIELDEHGAILDGHHRKRAWDELKKEGVLISDYPRIIRAGMTDEQKRNYIRALNILRRHLTKAQLEEQMKQMRRDGATYSQISRATGVNLDTAREKTKNELTEIRKLKGADGKKRPAKYKARKPRSPASPSVSIFANSAADENKAKESAAKISDDAPGTVLTTKRAARIGREQENAARDWAWSVFHRSMPTPARMIDLDYIEHCQHCKQSLLLGEVAQDVGQDYKNSTILRSLALAANKPGVTIFYKSDIIREVVRDIIGDEPDGIPHLGPLDIERIWIKLKSDERFLIRAQVVSPKLGQFKEFTAEQFWQMIKELHDQHDKKYHAGFTQY